jgi:hypothetical protein
MSRRDLGARRHTQPAGVADVSRSAGILRVPPAALRRHERHLSAERSNHAPSFARRSQSPLLLLGAPACTSAPGCTSSRASRSASGIASSSRAAAHPARRPSASQCRLTGPTRDSRLPARAPSRSRRPCATRCCPPGPGPSGSALPDASVAQEEGVDREDKPARDDDGDADAGPDAAAPADAGEKEEEEEVEESEDWEEGEDGKEAAADSADDSAPPAGGARSELRGEWLLDENACGAFCDGLGAPRPRPARSRCIPLAQFPRCASFVWESRLLSGPLRRAQYSRITRSRGTLAAPRSPCAAAASGSWSASAC